MKSTLITLKSKDGRTHTVLVATNLPTNDAHVAYSLTTAMDQVGKVQGYWEVEDHITADQTVVSVNSSDMMP